MAAVLIAFVLSCLGYCSNEIILELSMGKNVTSYWTSLGQCSLHPLTPQEGGGALGCLTSEICAGYQSEAMNQLMSGNNTGYCRLQSKAIACYTGDLAGCNKPGLLDITYSAHYAACSLTGVDVTRCSELTTASCSEERLNMLNNEDLQEYCRDMGIYMTCINNNMNQCQSRVTIYDVLGVEFASYEQMCSDASATEHCQTLTLRNCSSLFSPPNDQANQEDNCRSMGQYLDCMDISMKYCNPSVNPADIYGPVQEGYNKLCESDRTSSTTSKMEVSCAILASLLLLQLQTV